jgi:hypothetical protein
VTGPSQSDGRLAALRWAATRDAASSAALERWHPDHAALGTAAPDALHDLLWSETPDSDAGSPNGAAYWQHRRRAALDTEWAWVMGVLPDIFRVLAELTPDALERLLLELAVEMVARAAPDDKEELRNFLPPAGKELARRIVDCKALTRKGNGDSTSTDEPSALSELANTWRRLYIRGANKGRTRTDLLRSLALMQLASVSRLCLDPTVLAAVGRHARSNLFVVLATARVAFETTPTEAAALEPLLLDICGRLGRRRPGSTEKGTSE